MSQKQSLIASASAVYYDNATQGITPLAVRQLNDLWITSSVVQEEFNDYTGSGASTFAGTASRAEFSVSASYLSGSIESSSYASTASYLDATDLFISGNLTVIGTASFQYVHTTYESASVIYSSGSNQFGDATDDVQSLIGTVTVSGSLEVTGALKADLDGTASYAVTASFVSGTIESASYSLSSSLAETASFAFTASYLSGSVETASFALTASYLSGSAETASFAFTASIADTASLAFTSSLSITSSVAFTSSYLHWTGSSFEIHVSDNNGVDATGRGTLLYPYKSINYAISQSAAASGRRLIIHRGQYNESVALTNTNWSIVGFEAGNGALVEILGTLTVNVPTPASTRISNIRIANLVHQNSGGIFFQNAMITNTATFSGTGYVEFSDCRIEGTSISVTGNSTVYVQGSTFYPLVQNSAGSVVYLKNVISTVNPTIQAGTFVGVNTLVYTAVSGTAAINSSAGTSVNLINCQVATTTGILERINIGGFLSYADTSFNKQASTLGTQTGYRTDFQTVGVNSLIATGSLFGTSSWSQNSVTASFLSGSVATASFAFTSSLATTASFALTASYLSGSIESSSYAATASYLDGTASFAISSSYAISASWSDTALTSSFSVTASYVLSSSYAESSSYALSSSYAVSASWGDIALSSSYAETAQTASYIMFADLIEADDDTDAASKGVPVNGIYANGNFILRRIS